jgi:hypothetical protein
LIPHPKINTEVGSIQAAKFLKYYFIGACKKITSIFFIQNRVLMVSRLDHAVSLARWA